MLVSHQTELRWVKDEHGMSLQERTATTVVDEPRPVRISHTAWRDIPVVNKGESTEDEVSEGRGITVPVEVRYLFKDISEYEGILGGEVVQAFRKGFEAARFTLDD